MGGGGALIEQQVLRHMGRIRMAKDENVWRTRVCVCVCVRMRVRNIKLFLCSARKHMEKWKYISTHS